MLLAKALSNVSGYEYILNRPVYEWRRLYQIDESQMYTFINQFLIISSSIFQRIEEEYEFSPFVSSGAIFSEVLSLKSKMDEKRIELYEPKEFEMIEYLLNLTGRYAARHYDMVIHVQNPYFESFDKLSIGFYEKYHITYKLYNGDNDMEETLKNIIHEVEIPMVQSTESAIYRAIQLVTFKNWK